MIEARRASKHYGDVAVIDNISLRIPAGGLTTIIGHNGAGKSSLLGMVSRLAPASSGTVTVDGVDVTRTPTDVLARRLAILKQDNQTVTRLTVRELVAFGRYPYSKGQLTKADRTHINAAMVNLELEPLADRFMDELSGGQRQRAYIAMVLCQDTEYVLLDEPINSLDIHHSVVVMKLLKDLAKNLGKTIVLVLHDINFASCYSDHIVAMHKGRVEAQGTPQDIIRTELLQELYGQDVTVHEINGQRIGVYYR